MAKIKNGESTPTKRTYKTKKIISTDEVSQPPIIEQTPIIQNNRQIPTLGNSDSWSPKIANIIAFVALVISTILAYYTYKVFKLSDAQSESVKKSAEAAMEAAATAKNTLVETKNYNRDYMALQRKVYDSNNQDALKRGKIDSENRESTIKTLDAQVASLSQTQKRFEAENEPYLQISIDTAIVTKDVQKLTYVVSNLKETPIKVLKRRVSYYVSNKEELTNLDTIKLNYINTYVTKETPYHGYLNPKLILTEDDLFGITKKKNVFMFLKGEIYYENLISRANRVYKYTLKISFFGNGNMYQEYLQNENYTLKNN